MLQFLNRKSNSTSILKLVQFIFLIAFFISTPHNLFAQNIEKYRLCLDEKDYNELDVLVKELENLKQAKNEKLETYTPKQGFKDKNFEAFCKLPFLPTWVSSTCKVYDLGQKYNKVSDNSKLYGFSFIPDSGVNGQYRKYLRENERGCKDSAHFTQPNQYHWQLPVTTTKHTDLIFLLVYKGWRKYCIKIKRVEDKIKALKEKCSIVPNITGKCLDKARLDLEKVILFPKSDIKVKNRNDESKWEVYKQFPESGTLLRKTSDVKAKIRSSIKDIKLSQYAWSDAKPETSKQITAKAYFKCSDLLNLTNRKEGRWESSNKDVATVQNGKITIAKDAKNGQEATITVKYPSKGLSKSKQIKVKVKSTVDLKEIILKPVGSTLLKSIDNPKEIKAFALFSDGSKQEITKSKEIKWKANKPFVDFQVKGRMTIGVVCWKSLEVTADYQYKGKTYQSKSLVYKIHPDYTYVPWVITEKKAKAIKMLKENKLVPDVRENAVFDKSYAANEVIFQDPLYCVIAKKGSKVLLEINPDPSNIKIKVPDLLGKDLQDASSIVKQLGLSLQAKFPHTFNTKFKPGVICNQNPQKGTLVQSGTFIKVNINPNPKKVKVPNLICMTEQQAKSVLNSLKLTLNTNMASSYDSQCKKGEIIEQSPRKGDQVLEGSKVSVLLNPSSKPLMGILIKPEEKHSYPLNTPITFVENITRKTTGNTYRFEWYRDGKKVGKDKKYTYAFKKPGQHYIMLDLFSSDRSENDTIRVSIYIEYPVIKEAECNVTFEPQKSKYIEGDGVTFVVNGKNLDKVTKYQWYINDREVGSGKRITHTFNDQGTYKIKLGLRMGSNFNEVICKKNIIIGSGLRVAGHRNDFIDMGGSEDLSIYSKYWIGGSPFGKWSEYRKFSEIGSVDGYKLCTGDQADLFNAGFLVYKKKGSYKLSFEVYHFNFIKSIGSIEYKGDIRKSHNPKPESISTQCHQNVVEVGWTNEDGSNCSTHIWKYRNSSMLAHSGVDEPVCSKPTVNSSKLKRCKKFAKTAIKQFDENIKRKCNLLGDEWHDREEDHKKWCLAVPKKEADVLTKHRADTLNNCGKTWCDAYAKKAVEENEKNIIYGCGYKSKRWQSNYGNHHSWCLTNSKKAASVENRKRDQLLQKCIGSNQGVCDKYAQKALKKNVENLQRGCGFCGARWQSSYGNHFKWCLTHKNLKSSEEKAREDLLRKCSNTKKRKTRTFYEPCFNGYRLDNCLNHGTNCEKPAADKFCKSKGYTKSSDWNKEYINPTYTMDDNRICDADYCVGFKYITCSGYTNPDNTNPECRILKPKSGIVVQTGKYVHFKAEASDKEKDRLKYIWKFEGGHPNKWESEQRSSITTQWKNSGIYRVTLTVTDKKGGSCTDTATIIVQDKGSTFDCDQYADKSVSQNEENLRKKCGFSDNTLWYSSKSGHTNWCFNFGQEKATQNIAIREKALNECKKPIVVNTGFTCNITSPSKIAFTDAGKSLNFKGSASGDQLSYVWKFGEYGTQPSLSNKQNPGKVIFKWAGNYEVVLTVTDTDGQTCSISRNVLVYDSKDPHEFCESYAAISLKQNKENKSNNCNLNGEHWHDNEYNHQKWCQSVSLDQARNGLKIRDDALRKCKGGSSNVQDNNLTKKTIINSALVSGTYRVVQGRWNSIWKLNIVNGQITGTSEWTCCPSQRIDPIKGKISGDMITIERDCTGKDWKGACRQTYRGKFKNGRIEGTCSGTGLGAGSTWVLYIDGLAVKHPNSVNNSQSTYWGCYIDKPDRDIKGYHFNHGHMTNKMCINTCREKGFSIAATQFSTHCFCGNSFGNYGKAPKQDECKYRCKGNEKTNCGGYWRNSVYKIGLGAVSPPVNPKGNAIENRNKFCKNYANQAVKQQRANLNQKCNYIGLSWSSNYNIHYNWCLKTLGTGKPEDQAKVRNDALVKCTNRAHKQQTFINPKWKGHIVDNCVTWATTCDGGGAQNFCRLKGYKKALKWKHNRPGTTYVIGSNKVCRGNFCVGYSSITCVK